MKIKVISYGQKKNGLKTAQIVINSNGHSTTKHLYKGHEGWRDKEGQQYQVPAQ
jgi:hypothetical protein